VEDIEGVSQKRKKRKGIKRKKDGDEMNLSFLFPLIDRCKVGFTLRRERAEHNKKKKRNTTETEKRREEKEKRGRRRRRRVNGKNGKGPNRRKELRDPSFQSFLFKDNSTASPSFFQSDLLQLFPIKNTKHKRRTWMKEEKEGAKSKKRKIEKKKEGEREERGEREREREREREEKDLIVTIPNN